jgi:HAD superfamily hydrolase (TIGR01509 family)
MRATFATYPMSGSDSPITQDASGPAATVPSQAAGGDLKALIFDVDGTLYEQAPVRRAMLYRILRANLTSPMQGMAILQALRSYRKAHEELRHSPSGSGEIARAQVRLASQATGISPEIIASYVTKWMEEEPLSLLATWMRRGTIALLQAARQSGLKLAVCSDYPAERKLAAMGIAPFFDVVVTAQDPQVERLKPDPRGLEVTLRRLAVTSSEAVYIGDRSDVDAAAGLRAGIKYFILRGHQDFSELLKLLIKPTH